MSTRTIIASLSLLLLACGATTEIVLVIDTDIEGATELRVTATGPDGERRTSSADLSTQAAPRTLVLLHRGGELGAVRLTIEARIDGAPAVSVTREVAFQPGRSLRLPVFLAAECRDAMCAAPLTCGNAGECRSAIVPACEYEASCGASDAGVDAGVDSSVIEDDGGADGGGCPLSGVCGVVSQHLPGDRVQPAPCGSLVEPWEASVTSPSGGAIAGVGGVFTLQEPGPYQVILTLADEPACRATRSIEVSTPVRVADSTPVSAEELRDLAARVGAAFVVGRRGAYAIDSVGWYALRPVAAGDALPEDLRGVAVFAGQPIVGTHADLNSIYRLYAEAPFDASSVTSTLVALPTGSREVYAIDVRLDGEGSVLVATKDGAVLVDDIDATPGARALGATYDPTVGGFAAIGADEPATRGAIWIAKPDEIVNRSAAAGPTFASGAGAPLPALLSTAHEAEIDDRDPAQPRLWICGDGGVAMWMLTGDWSTMSELPSPTRFWSGACRDLAIGDDGEVWLASGSAGIVRLDLTAFAVVRYDAAMGFPSGVSADRIAFAHDGSRREVVVLDATSSTRAVVFLSADALP